MPARWGEDGPGQDQHGGARGEVKAFALVAGGRSGGQLFADFVRPVAQFGKLGDRAARDLRWLGERGTGGDIDRVTRRRQLGGVVVGQDQPSPDDDWSVVRQTESPGNVSRRGVRGDLEELLGATLAGRRCFGSPGVPRPGVR
jgi:hypothetical protein